MQDPISLNLLNLSGKGDVNKSHKAREEKQIKRGRESHQASGSECLLSKLNPPLQLTDHGSSGKLLHFWASFFSSVR